MASELVSENHSKSSSQLISEPLTQRTVQSESKGNLDIGPQYAQDNSLARRMRKHQSCYRLNQLHIPYGTGPKPSDTSYYGNMLTRADGASGRNFLTQEIFEVVLDRIAKGGGAVEKFRLLHNMLSSQPMCFNLFGPLVKDHDLAKKLLETLVPERISEVIQVEIEWSPKPAEEFLNDRTAFDAFIEYRTVNGKLLGLGIETKLSEPFSQKNYDRSEYRRWMQRPDSPFRPEAWNKVQAIEYNQLWREHLLALALRFHPKSTYAQVRLLLVHHPEDGACVKNYSNYKKLLQAYDDTLFKLSLDQIVDRWLSVVKQEEHQNWLLSFKKRYIDLD